MHDGKHTATGDDRDRRIGRRALAVHAAAIDAFSDGERAWIAATGDDWQDDVPAIGTDDGEDGRGEDGRGEDGRGEGGRGEGGRGKPRHEPTDRVGDSPVD